jgi:hypothetical protein
VRGWSITDPRIFFGIAAAVVGYVLYMMIRRRKGERSPVASQELEL